MRTAAYTPPAQDIGVAAGAARDAFVSPGQYVAEEYRLAKADTDAWIAAGKIAAPCAM